MENSIFDKIKEYYNKNDLSYLIICFVNINYKSLLANWIQFMYKQNIYHFCIVCLDKYILKKCLEYNLFCVYYPVDVSYNFNNLWIKRIEFINTLVKLDIPLIHTDIDAIWVDNPIEYLKKLSDKTNADIIGSQGLIFPETSFKKNGFIICCGFFLINPTPNSKKWVEKWEFETKKNKDDQVAFNRLLEWTNISIEEMDEYFKDGSRVKFPQIINYKQIINLYEKQFLLNCSNNPRIIKTSEKSQLKLKLVLLPMTGFQRVPISKCKEDQFKNDKVFIKHYFTDKKEEDKIELFKKHKLWEDDSSYFFTTLTFE